MNIPFTQHTLENGLRVIIHEDRRLPMVAVNLWYHVGSKNEHPGRTGFAHLFEHLMFEGSQHYDTGYFHPLQEAGAALNGSTNPDRTNYWEVVPTNALDLGCGGIRFGWSSFCGPPMQNSSAAGCSAQRATPELREHPS